MGGSTKFVYRNLKLIIAGYLNKCNEHFEAILAKMADSVTNLSRSTSFCGAITSVVVASEATLRNHAACVGLFVIFSVFVVDVLITM